MEREEIDSKKERVESKMNEAERSWCDRLCSRQRRRWLAYFGCLLREANDINLVVDRFN